MDYQRKIDRTALRSRICLRAQEQPVCDGRISWGVWYSVLPHSCPESPGYTHGQSPGMSISVREILRGDPSQTDSFYHTTPVNHRREPSRGGTEPGAILLHAKHPPINSCFCSVRHIFVHAILQNKKWLFKWYLTFGVSKIFSCLCSVFIWSKI